MDANGILTICMDNPRNADRCKSNVQLMYNCANAAPPLPPTTPLVRLLPPPPLQPSLPPRSSSPRPGAPYASALSSHHELLVDDGAKSGARAQPTKETQSDGSSKPRSNTALRIAAVVTTAALCLCMCGARACAVRCMLPDQRSGTASPRRRARRRRIPGYEEHADEELSTASRKQKHKKPGHACLEEEEEEEVSVADPVAARGRSVYTHKERHRVASSDRHMGTERDVGLQIEEDMEEEPRSGNCVSACYALKGCVVVPACCFLLIVLTAAISLWTALGAPSQVPQTPPLQIPLCMLSLLCTRAPHPALACASEAWDFD